MTHKIRLTEQGRKALHTGCHAAGYAAPLRQCFTHQTGRYGQDQPDNGNKEEDAFPRGKAQDLAADDGSQNRCNPIDQHEHGKEPRQGAALADVAGNGPGQDDTGTTGTALDEPEDEEDLNGRRPNTAHRRQGKDRHADHQGQAAPLIITDRADGDLPQRHAGHRGRQSQLDDRRRHAKGRHHRRQGWQIHIRRQRCNSCQHP